MYCLLRSIYWKQEENVEAGAKPRYSNRIELSFELSSVSAPPTLPS